MTSGLGRGIDDVLRKLEREGFKVPRPMLSPLEQERALYQRYKGNWFFHSSSWYMNHDNGFKGEGCNHTGCISECPFFPKSGRIRDNTITYADGSKAMLNWS